MTDIERLRSKLEALLLAGRQPTDPEVLEVSRRLDQLIAREMRPPAPAADGIFSMVERSD